VRKGREGAEHGKSDWGVTTRSQIYENRCLSGLAEAVLDSSLRFYMLC
jgi:hypothetical protein